MTYRVDQVWGSTTRFDGVNTTYGHPATYAIWGGKLFAAFPSHNRALVERICSSLNAFADELAQEKARTKAESVALGPKSETKLKQARGEK